MSKNNNSYSFLSFNNSDWVKFRRRTWENSSDTHKWVKRYNALKSAKEFIITALENKKQLSSLRMLIFRGLHGTGKTVLLNMLRSDLDKNFTPKNRVVGPFDMARLLSEPDRAVTDAHQFFYDCDPHKTPIVEFPPTEDDPDGLICHITKLINEFTLQDWENYDQKPTPLIILLDNLHTIYTLKWHNRHLWRVFHNLFINKFILAHQLPIIFICAARHSGNTPAGVPAYLEDPLTKFFTRTNDDDLSVEKFTPQFLRKFYKSNLKFANQLSQTFYKNPLLIEFFSLSGTWDAYNHTDVNIRNPVIDKAIELLIEDSLLPQSLQEKLPDFVAYQNNLFDANFSPSGTPPNSVQMLVQLGLAHPVKEKNRYQIAFPLAALIAKRHNIQISSNTSH